MQTNIIAVGLIPAYAGSTMIGANQHHCRRAHPRLRGEHPLQRLLPSRNPGSSPLTRGAHRRRRPRVGVGGLIPAYAGSTATTYAPAGAGRGSSPLTRRAPHTVFYVSPGAGLIPACAGSTGDSHSSFGSVQAHPRLRGEHRSMTTRAIKQKGSSPLTRGARF